jgi:hypothetical protein
VILRPFILDHGRKFRYFLADLESFIHRIRRDAPSIARDRQWHGPGNRVPVFAKVRARARQQALRLKQAGAFSLVAAARWGSSCWESFFPIL